MFDNRWFCYLFTGKLVFFYDLCYYYNTKHFEEREYEAVKDI